MRQSEYGNVRPRRCSNDNRIARTFNVLVVSANSWLPIRRKGRKNCPKGCFPKAEDDLWPDDSYKLFEKSAVMFCPFLLIIAAGSAGSVAQNKVGEIDDAWCLRMHDRLDDLFRKANVAYVIPRDINAAWLTTLPSLPHGLDWTLLLLQEVLDKYPAIGFKSISPDLNQTLDTLAAAFVPVDSPLQTFPDVVTLFMEEHHDLPMRMPGEDLRLELRDAGMLENGEMIYALPKALNDYRFAWSNENKTVYVRGNK